MSGALNVIGDWLAWSLSPSLSAIFLTFVIAVLLPVLLHNYLYRASASVGIPSIVLIGPSAAGKTSLFTLLANGTPSKTHTSQEPQTARCTLPAEYKASSQQFRSQNDPSAKTRPEYSVTDTPGHGKLRPGAIALLLDAHSASNKSSMTGSNNNDNNIIFVVDSAALSVPRNVSDTAGYLHDVLLSLQRNHDGKTNTSASTATSGSGSGRGSGSGSGSGTSGPDPTTQLLIAANKSDLFTSLPAHSIRAELEAEITRIRSSRSKGLLVHADDQEGDADSESNWLGSTTSSAAAADGDFRFEEVLESAGVRVRVLSGNVVGSKGESGDVKEWMGWVAERL